MQLWTQWLDLRTIFKTFFYRGWHHLSFHFGDIFSFVIWKNELFSFKQWSYWLMLCLWNGDLLKLRSLSTELWSATILTHQKTFFMKLVAHMSMILCLFVCPGPCTVMIVYLCVYLSVIWWWITSHPCGLPITPVTGQAVVMTCESSVLLFGYVSPP